MTSTVTSATTGTTAVTGPLPGPAMPPATVTWLLPATPPPMPRRPVTAGALALSPEPDPAVLPAARLDGPGDLELKAWAGRLAQALVEAVAGRRPVPQLLRWTTPEVYADVERRAAAVARAAGGRARSVRPQVRSVHLCRPTPDAAEVSVHLSHGPRSRALALRLERVRGRWQCAALAFG